MKKVYAFLALVFLSGIQTQGQGLQPNYFMPDGPRQHQQKRCLEALIQNHYLQKNINDLYVGYCHPLRHHTLWANGRWSNQSLIQTKSIGAGCQIWMGAQTLLSHELSFLHDQFPERIQEKQWVSRARAQYTNEKFLIQYQHFWTWSSSLPKTTCQPLQTILLQLQPSELHQIQISMWQFDNIQGQLLIQHQFNLHEKWNFSWGFQWPQSKYWVVLKNKKGQIQSSFCLLAQPYFLPSFYQYHEMDLH